MFNTSVANVSYAIYDGSTLLCEGVAPYLMVPHLINTMNYTQYHVVFTQLTTTYPPQYSIDHYIRPQRDHHYTIDVYGDIQMKKALYEQATLDASNLALARLAADEAAYGAQQLWLGEQVRKAETQYVEMLQNQELLTAERARMLEEEQQRLDMLRVQTVTSVAMDPVKNTIPALMSEVGTNNDVHRQIAAILPQHEDLALTLIASTSTLWIDSYEIMDVLSVMAVTNDAVRTALLEALPSDSALHHTLITIAD